MKKNYLKILLTAITTLSFVFTTSCSSDDDTTSLDEKKNGTLLTSSQIANYKLEYSYDSQNRLIKISESYLNTDSSIDSTNIFYDYEGRISQTIHFRNNNETQEETIQDYVYSGDFIYVIDRSNSLIDTLIVVNDELLEKRNRQFVTQYSYDNNGNLIQSDEKEINNPTYLYRSSYTYNLSKKGLLQDAKTPSWYNVTLYDRFNINYSPNICTSYNFNHIMIEDGIENGVMNSTMYVISYEYDDDKPTEITETKIGYDEVYTYTFEYTKK